MAFFVTSPISITMPIIAGMPRCWPVASSMSSAPTSASGSASMMITGSVNDSNCEASTM